MRARAFCLDLPHALVVTLIAGGVAMAAGCGSSKLPGLAGGGGGGDDVSAGGDDDGGVDDDATTSTLGGGASTVQMCGVGPDGGVCACSDIQPLGTPPNLYFVLDRSASMATDNKWNTVRTVVSKIMTGLGPRANFGAAVFPGISADECGPGQEVFALRQGDSPAGTYGPTAQGVFAATNFTPAGGTPTAATLTALLSKVKAFSGKTYVILATDGGPNCSDVATCDASQCIPNIESESGCMPSGATCCIPSEATGSNCLDTAASVQAVAALKAAGIPVYVVGIPGSAPYQDVLDQMATAGGTAQSTEPLYYAASSTDETQINAALSQVAAKIIGNCTVTLANAPPDENLVNVYLDNIVLPKDPANGWGIAGSTVTLLGTACQEVLAGKVLDVRVVAGCPTVLR